MVYFVCKSVNFDIPEELYSSALVSGFLSDFPDEEEIVIPDKFFECFNSDDNIKKLILYDFIGYDCPNLITNIAYEIGYYEELPDISDDLLYSITLREPWLLRRYDLKYINEELRNKVLKNPLKYDTVFDYLEGEQRYEGYCREGNYEVIKYIIIETSSNSCDRSDYRYILSTMLVIACEYDQVNIAKILIRNGAVVEHKNYLPLRKARNNGCIELIEYLESHINVDNSRLGYNKLYSFSESDDDYEPTDDEDYIDDIY